MSQVEVALVDEATFAAIPAPAAPGARCQTCDYWERIDGSREARGDAAARERKLSRLLAGARLAGAYGMLAFQTDTAGDRVAVGWAQFGPISAYPRAQSIRERYPELPESPAPWVITCLQVPADAPERDVVAARLVAEVCDELDRRGIVAVEAYPEGGVGDPWAPPPGPAAVYAGGGFEQVAGDARFPVMRRELGSGGDVGWGDLLERARPADEGEDWPLPMPSGPSEDDLFRLPEKPKRPNPFGDD